MSARVIGYEGEGRARRPVFADEGPASGRGRGGTPGDHAEVARLAQADASKLVEVGGRMPSGGASTIERRMVTEAERGRWRQRDEAPSPIARVTVARPALGSPEHIQASRMRGAARHVQVMAERRSAPTATEEEPPVSADIAPPPEDEESPEPLGATLSILADAARLAQEAWEQRERAEANWIAARQALEGSWLATWFGFQGPLPRDAEEPEQPPHDHVHYSGRGATIDEAIADLGPPFAPEPADDAPEVVTRRPEPVPAAGGGPAIKLGKQQRRILELTVANKGDRQATAAAMGLTVTAVLSALHTIGRKGALPIELIPLLPAGFAKYTGV